ncbi:MAG: hypothetical protein GY953_44955 [bacterium]|nr:hypothetical protein [bacterium]
MGWFRRRCLSWLRGLCGGNGSLYNETLGEGVRPSPVLGIVGLMKTTEPVPLEFQHAGRALVLLGGLGTCELVRFGGTQYAKAVLKDLWGLPPALDMDLEKRVQAAVRKIVRTGAAESAHDVGSGGLAVALAECCFGPAGIGAAVELSSNLRNEFLLFHEAPSRVLVSTTAIDAVQAIAAELEVAAPVIGKTQADWLDIDNQGSRLIHLDVRDLKARWEGALPAALHPAEAALA